MTTYYPGPGIQITHEAVRILAPVPRTLWINELQEPYIAWGRHEPAAWWRPLSRAQELRAFYRGRLVVLFSTPDQRVFGQVTRSLVRALEAHRASTEQSLAGRT